MIVHVYGSAALREWVVHVTDATDPSLAMAEALRRVKTGEAGEGAAARTTLIAVVPEGQPVTG